MFRLGRELRGLEHVTKPGNCGHQVVGSAWRSVPTTRGQCCFLLFCTGSPIAPVDISLWLKQEAEEPPCADLGPAEGTREVSPGSRAGEFLAHKHVPYVAWQVTY